MVHYRAISTAHSTSTEGEDWRLPALADHDILYPWRDGLGGIDERHPDLNVPLPHDPSDYPGLEFTDRPGADVALDILKSEARRSVSYLLLGPMTTLACLCREHGDVFRDRIGRILCMGGALDVPGNTSPVSECQRSRRFFRVLLLR